MAKYDNDSSYFRFRGGINKTSTTFLAKLQDRDSVAWKDFMDIYVPLIKFWCRERRGELTRMERQDILQEILQKVSLSLTKFDITRQKRSFRGWLRRITQHQLCDFLRQKAKDGKVVRLHTDVDYPDDPFPTLGDDEEKISFTQETAERLVLLKQILKRIKPVFKEKSWEVFNLLVVAEKGSSEVAEMMGMKGAAVRQVRSRILQRLREEYVTLGLESDLPSMLTGRDDDHRQ